MFDCVKESNCREDIYEARCNMLRRNKVTFVAVKFVWTATLYVTINSLKSHEVIWPGVVIRALAIFRRKRTGGGKSRMYCACLVVRVRQVIFPRFYCALNGVSPRRSFWETTVLPVTTILPQVGVSFLLSLASLIMLVCGVGVGVPKRYLHPGWPRKRVLNFHCSWKKQHLYKDYQRGQTIVAFSETSPETMAR